MGAGASAPSSWNRSLGSTARQRAILAVQHDRRQGLVPPIEKYWDQCGSQRSTSDLAAIVKTDLQARFEYGDNPAADEYLDRFPELKAAKDQVLSLVYEEFCLREERGEKPDPALFCERYHPWRDSLASQLKYHELLSSVVGSAVEPAPPFPEAGDKFQSFQLQCELGRGSAGRVYLALEESLGAREVALKISPDRGGEPSIQGRLDHDHIVPVLSVTRQPDTGLRGLCMPYRPGHPLDEVIRRVAPASGPANALVLWTASASASADPSLQPTSWVGFPAEGSYAEGAAWVISRLADALAHAHARGVYHRDVKPANVLMTPRSGPQLLDFNLAHAPHAAEAAEAALRGGTLPYMAPEQLEAFLDPNRWENVGAAADLYALGLLLAEMLTGRRPDGPDPNLPLPRAIRNLMDRRSGAPPSLRAENPAIPHALDAIVGRCLEHQPERRYATGLDLAEDLTRFIDHLPLKHAVNPSRKEVALNWVGTHRAVCASVLGVFILIVAGLDAFIWIRSRGMSGISSWFGVPAPIVVAPDPPKTTPKNSAPPKKESPKAAAVAASNRGWALLDAEQYDDARVEFMNAIALAPDHPKANEGLGTAYYHLGYYEKSRESYEKTIKLWRSPNPHVGVSHRAIVPYYLAETRVRLAATLSRLAKKALEDGEGGVSKADALFQQSLDQLDLADPDLKKSPDPRKRANVIEGAKFTRGDALAARGDIARKQGNRRDAVLRYHEALGVLDRYQPGDPRHIPQRESIKDQIRKALEELKTP